MSTKKVKMTQEVKAPQANVSIDSLKQQLAEMQQQKEAFQNVASVAASNLIAIENRFAPLLARKFNFFNAIFHLEQYILLIKEIVALIKDFREKFVQKTDN